MNYTQLKTAIEDYTQNYETTFIANIPVFVEQAEQRIYNSVQFPSLRKNVTGILTANNKYLSCPNDAHKKYPYLLSDIVASYPNHVWSTDITYLKLPGGTVYLMAMLDLYSRKVLSWEVSNTMDTLFCQRVLYAAIKKYGIPEILNTDQGSQYTSARLLSKGKFEQTYGRFEARIKIPTGQGLWPAFWLMPDRGPAFGRRPPRPSWLGSLAPPPPPRPARLLLQPARGLASDPFGVVPVRPQLAA